MLSFLALLAFIIDVFASSSSKVMFIYSLDNSNAVKTIKWYNSFWVKSVSAIKDLCWKDSHTAKLV